MELVGRAYTTFGNTTPERFLGRVTDRVWISTRWIFQEFFIVDTVPGTRPCLLGMPFVAATNPSFCYNANGSMDCTMEFGSIDIKAQVSRARQYDEISSIYEIQKE